MKKILVTGAAGFIGHRVSELLLKDNIEVVGIDNLNDYYDLALKNYRISTLKGNEKFNFYPIDIENLYDLKELFSEHQFDAVINLAARAGVRYSVENPDIYVSTNVQGNLNLLNMCKEHGIFKYILASTSSLYAGKEMPFVETLDVSEPISPYAASKKGGEVMCYAYHHLYNIDVSIVRYFTVYGPLSRPDMAQLWFMKWIDEGKEILLNGDGTQSRDFTYIDDIAKGTIAALKKVGYEIFNLGGGNNPISINQMIQSYEKLLGKKAKVKNLPFDKSDMTKTWADISKTKKLLGWVPETDFETGVQKCVSHYKENLEFYKSIRLN